jgi:xanthine dehydrogenase accessory factor
MNPVAILPDLTHPADRVDHALSLLAAEPGVLVEVIEVRGSTPREPGAWMLVNSSGIVNTIGGGHLEFEAVHHARQMLALGNATVDILRKPLGPSLGQCCGGVIHLRFERIDCQRNSPHPTRAILPEIERRLRPALTPVALFGAGHVGHAIAQALSPLPFRLHWIDGRESVFGPVRRGNNLHTEVCDPPQDAVASIDPDSRVLVMSFSHAEDLDIIRQCLLRRRKNPASLSFIGLIGSETKWARFRSQLLARGFTPTELRAVTCPIGIPGIRGKEPEVIAASVVAQLLRIGSGVDQVARSVEAMDGAKGLPEMADRP